MPRLLARIAVAIVLVVAVVTTIGYALPQEHVAVVTRFVPMPPAAVFARITDAERYPDWREDVERVEVISLTPLKWREHSGGDTITFEMTESVPATRVVSRIADPDLPFGGTWTYDLRADGTGTHVTITERGEVYNPIFRFLSRFVFGHTGTMETVLDGLTQTKRSS